MSDKATNKKPIYRRRWFVIPLGVVVVLFIIGAVFPNKSTPPTTTTIHALSASARFRAIAGKALPGLPSNNWPVFTYVSEPPEVTGASAEQYTSSKNRGLGFGGTRSPAFVVYIFNFPNADAEAKFYEDSNNVLDNIIGDGSGIAAAPGNTGIAGKNRGFSFTECGGSSLVEPGNKCSGSASKPVFAGVMTLIERGSTIAVIVDSGLLVENAKVAQSVVTLLASVGFN
jgi:hypothetical protein